MDKVSKANQAFEVGLVAGQSFDLSKIESRRTPFSLRTSSEVSPAFPIWIGLAKHENGWGAVSGWWRRGSWGIWFGAKTKPHYLPRRVGLFLTPS